MSLVLVVLTALALAAATATAAQSLRGSARRSPSWGQVWLVLLLSLLWLLVDDPVEGATLVVIAPEHGVTVADLLVVPPLVVAALLAHSQRLDP